MHPFMLPENYSIVRLQALPLAEQKALLPLVFALTEAQYPEWPAEQEQNWLSALNGGNARGTKMAASVILNPLGIPEGLSALELYVNATAIINYSVAKRDSTYYQPLIYTATKDMCQAIADMQAKGASIDFVAKEHHLQSERAIAGFHAVGQVPIDGPTSLLESPIKYYEVAYGDPKHSDSQSHLAHAMRLADPKTGPQMDEVVHLWLIRDFVPSHPDRSLADLLRNFASAYTLEHSIYRETDHRKDPGFQSLLSLADHLPQKTTYQQAVAASLRGAAAWMGLEDISRTSSHLDGPNVNDGKHL